MWGSRSGAPGRIDEARAAPHPLGASLRFGLRFGLLPPRANLLRFSSSRMLQQKSTLTWRVFF